MQSPCPGLDPYLVHAAPWPDVHNRLIAAWADDLSERVAPRYRVRLERCTYLLEADDLVCVGRPGLALASTSDIPPFARQQVAPSVLVLELDLALSHEIAEKFLEIHAVKTGKVVTIVELLSPANKRHRQGREEYTRKHGDVCRDFQAMRNPDSS